MPYKNRPSSRTIAKRQPVKQVQLVTDNLGMILTEIVGIARRVTIKEVMIAESMAKAKAPVRRVFKGGRATFRPIGRIERFRAVHRMLLAEPTLVPYQIRAARTMTHPNRKNTFARSWNLREATHTGRKDGLDQFSLKSSWTESHSLNKEGRRALKEAKLVEREIEGQTTFLDVGRRRAIHVSLDDKGNPVYHLGGNLRASIRWREDSFESIRYSVVAGGERAPYAKFMEFGTRHVAARPFLRPALKHVERRYADRMYSAMNQAFPGQVRRGR